MENTIFRPSIRWLKDGLLIWVMLFTFFFDQGSKQLIRSWLIVGQSIPQDGLVKITHSYNSGAAFGLFPNQTMLLIIASVVGIVILLAFYRHVSIPGPLIQVSLGLQLGGAVGNLVDRITKGHVLDFIEVSVWPVFNLADASIVVGVLVLSWIFLQSERKKRLAKRDETFKSQEPLALEGEENPPADPWQPAKL
jgi:signal peptidase II